tara:strand:- start:230 stop:1087 length:858 start_codon:yes stop_codon:yes gene_type:complete
MASQKYRKLLENIKLNFRSLFSKQVVVRVTSSFLMAVPVIVFTLVGGVCFTVFVGLLAGIMSWEVTRTVCKPKNYIIEIGIGFVVVFLTLVFGLFFMSSFSETNIPLFSSLLIIVVFIIRKVHSVARVALGNLIVVFSCFCMIWLRSTFEVELFAWILLSVVATDIGAFFAGSIIGGIKLAPNISPNKTWAGLLGGIFSSLTVAWIFYLLWLETNNFSLFIMAIVIAIISQVGDLVESAYKRSYKIKDSSKLIPGHGGVLDRLDGHMAAGIFMTFILLYYDEALI